MSLNKYMHKRNPFKNKKIDFKKLSEKYEFFKEVFTNTENTEEMTIDFKSPKHLAAISRALLMDIMHLDVYLPLDRLIPTIPLRMNYILWIEDLLKSAPIKTDKQLTVLDVGCGASCIYPLLGASKNGWFFKTTEIDDDNITIARQNISANNLTTKIEVLKVSENDEKILIHAFNDGNPVTYIHAVMCNPPFFANTLDKTSLLTTRNPDQRDSAKSVNTSIRSESLTDGGETGFAIKMIEESLSLGNVVGIFTIMLGKKSSSEEVKKYLISKSISNYSIIEFCQGRVMRWGVAWSFLPAFSHPKSEFQLSRQHNRPPLTWNIPPNDGAVAISSYSVDGVYEALKTICRTLQIEVLEQKNRQSEGGGSHLLLTAHRNTWSHQRRARRQLARASRLPSDDGAAEPPCKRRRAEADICSEAAALDCDSSHGDSSEIIDADGDAGVVLRCTVNVVVMVLDGCPHLQLQARHLDGHREALNQVLTFFKNKLLVKHTTGSMTTAPV